MVQSRCTKIACILMGNGMKSSRAAKHYEVRLNFLQESIKSKVIKFKYCDTNEMIADCLTKPLDIDKFCYFRKMMLHSPETANESTSDERADRATA